MSTLLGRLLQRWLAEPATRGMHLDDPLTTSRRRDIAATKRALYLANLDWYRRLARINDLGPPGPRVEIGSGGGFLAEHVAGLLQTDVLQLPFVDCVCDAQYLPFGSERIAAIFIIDVLHHVMEPRRFFREAERVLKPEGVLAMIEPDATLLSRLVYRHLHPEPFEPEAPDWELAPSGPLSGGNDALPWIIFVRDRDKYEAEFPNMRIETLEPHTSVSRLLTGGVMMRSLVPASLVPVLQTAERQMPRWMLQRIALFITIVLRKSA